MMGLDEVVLKQKVLVVAWFYARIEDCFTRHKYYINYYLLFNCAESFLA